MNGVQTATLLLLLGVALAAPPKTRSEYIQNIVKGLPELDPTETGRVTTTLKPETFMYPDGTVIKRKAVIQQWWDGEWHMPDEVPPSERELVAEGAHTIKAGKPLSKAEKKAAKKATKKAARAETKAARKATKAERRAARLKLRAEREKRYPSNCNCVTGPKGSGICHDFVKQGSAYCTRRSCLPSYTCVGRVTGLTCFRRRVRKRIVPTGMTTCKLEKVTKPTFMYVPYASA